MIQYEVSKGKYLLVNDSGNAILNMGMYVNDKPIRHMYSYLHAVKTDGRDMCGYLSGINRGYPSATIKDRRVTLGMIIANLLLLNELQAEGAPINGIEVSKSSAFQNILLAKSAFMKNEGFWSIIEDLLKGKFIEFFTNHSTKNYRGNSKEKVRSVIVPTRKFAEFMRNVSSEDIFIDEKLYGIEIAPVTISGAISSQVKAREFVQKHEENHAAFSLRNVTNAINEACEEVGIALNPIDKAAFISVDDEFKIGKSHYTLRSNALLIEEVANAVGTRMPLTPTTKFAQRKVKTKVMAKTTKVESEPQPLFIEQRSENGNEVLG